MSSSSLVLLLACLSCAVLSATSCCCDKEEPVKPVRCCPNGWTQFEERCYMYHHTNKDWVSAEKHCQTFGGNLASITKGREHIYVRNLIQRVTGHFPRVWIGAHDSVLEGLWMWTDGTKFIYKRWAANEPNNLNKEHCAEMNWRKNYWNDQKCTTKMAYVCSMILH